MRRGKYADYSVVVRQDSVVSVKYTDGANGGIVRAIYDVARIPSRRQFVISMRADATDADRRHLAATLPGIASLASRAESVHPEHVAKRKIAVDGGRIFAFVFTAGLRVDDPLVQLELEMMIDDSSANVPKMRATSAG